MGLIVVVVGVVIVGDVIVGVVIVAVAVVVDNVVSGQQSVSSHLKIPLSKRVIPSMPRST